MKPSLRTLALFLLSTALVHAADVVRPKREPAAGLLYYAKADYAHADNTAVIANPQN